MKQKCTVCNNLHKITFNNVLIDQCINCKILKMHIDKFYKIINNIIIQNSNILNIPINTILSKKQKLQLNKFKSYCYFEDKSLKTIKQINDKLNLLNYYNIFNFYYNNDTDMLYFFEQDFKKLLEIIFKKYKYYRFLLNILFLLKLDYFIDKQH